MTKVYGLPTFAGAVQPSGWLALTLIQRWPCATFCQLPAGFPAMWSTSPLTQLLGIRYPIIQGSFGGGLSSVELLAAVSEGSGLGSFGAHHLLPEQILALNRTIRTRTSRPYALNLWVSNQDTRPD